MYQDALFAEQMTRSDISYFHGYYFLQIEKVPLWLYDINRKADSATGKNRSGLIWY